MICMIFIKVLKNTVQIRKNKKRKVLTVFDDMIWYGMIWYDMMRWWYASSNKKLNPIVTKSEEEN